LPSLAGLWCLQQGAAVHLMGDVLFRDRSDALTFPSRHDQLISSIKNKILPLGDDVAFVCGHGPTSTIGAERESNPFID
jgi:glyoxylase-like metal-dependent hydrolase (beta-lactamase superfamily II)